MENIFKAGSGAPSIPAIKETRHGILPNAFNAAKVFAGNVVRLTPLFTMGILALAGTSDRNKEVVREGKIPVLNNYPGENRSEIVFQTDIYEKGDEHKRGGGGKGHPYKDLTAVERTTVSFEGDGKVVKKNNDVEDNGKKF